MRIRRDRNYRCPPTGTLKSETAAKAHYFAADFFAAVIVSRREKLLAGGLACLLREIHSVWPMKTLQSGGAGGRDLGNERMARTLNVRSYR